MDNEIKQKCSRCGGIATLHVHKHEAATAFHVTSMDGQTIFEGNGVEPTPLETSLCRRCAMSSLPEAAKPFVKQAVEAKQTCFIADAALLLDQLRPVFLIGGAVSFATKGGLVATANNGRVAVAADARCSCEIRADGEFTVETVDFLRALKPFGATQVQFASNRLELRLYDAKRQVTLPLAVPKVELPTSPSAFEPAIQISRRALLEAIKAVGFALGAELYRPEFLYWVLRVSPAGIRAIAGDGGRFSVYEIEGGCETDATRNIQFWRKHTPCLRKLLKAAQGDWVKIQTSAKPRQTRVEIDGRTVILHGDEHDGKWPNEKKFLDRVSPLKFMVSRNDFVNAAEAVAVIVPDYEYGMAITTVSFDPACGIIHLQGRNTHSSVIIEHTTSMTQEPGERLSMEVNSTYLSDLKRGEGDQLQFELLDERSVVVVRFLNGIYRTPYTHFFAPLSQSARVKQEG